MGFPISPRLGSLATSGTLYVVGTPIGNLGDITIRALETLRTVNAVAAEDTRRTGRLLEHFEISKEIVRYDDHTHDRVAPTLIARLQNDESIAHVTDAGMPSISDPGRMLVRAAHEAGIKVEVIPGPDAITTALAASGLPTAPFTFHGFAPRKSGERTRTLEILQPGTHVFYESPERIAAFASAIATVYPTALLSVCRELTKKFEEIISGTATEVAERVGGGVRGEIVAILYLEETVDETVTDEVLLSAAQELIDRGVDKKTAIQSIAKQFRVPKRRVYQLVEGH